MKRRAWILAAGLALLPPASLGDGVMFVEGLTGPSRMSGRTGWFDLVSTSWSIDRSNSAAPNTLVVVLNSSATTTALAQASAGSNKFQKIVVDQMVALSDTHRVLSRRLTCDGPLFRTMSASTAASEQEILSLTLQCAVMTWENFDYTSQGVLVGTGKATWDFIRNAPK